MAVEAPMIWFSKPSFKDVHSGGYVTCTCHLWFWPFAHLQNAWKILLSSNKFERITEEGPIMGGCCCSSGKYQLHGTPVYYYCPPSLEEHESLTSHDSAFSTGLLIDLNLDTSIPDTYRSPPTPIPFNVVLGCPQSTETEPVGQTFNGSGFEQTTCLNLKALDCKTEDDGSLLASPRKLGVEFQKSNVSITEEEDVCPTCLEEYDVENPRITTKCNHQFHLSCILEWMERSDTCPICNQRMDFEAL